LYIQLCGARELQNILVGILSRIEKHDTLQTPFYMCEKRFVIDGGQGQAAENI
jgi:hypothetical protein